MGALTITIQEKCCEELPQIKELDYNTFVTGVPSGNDNVYVKVKKCKHPDMFSQKGKKQSLAMKWEPDHCVLFNLKYGTLRQIPGETRVVPMAAEVTVCPLPRKRWDEVRKENYK